MREIIEELIKVVQDGEKAVDHLIDIDSEMGAIFKRFPLMSITEKKVAIGRYEELSGDKPLWLGQVNLASDFLQNTVNDLKSLNNNWLENRADGQKLKKLHKMLKNEFSVSNEDTQEDVSSKLDVEAQESLKKSLQEIESEMKTEVKQGNIKK